MHHISCCVFVNESAADGKMCVKVSGALSGMSATVCWLVGRCYMWESARCCTDLRVDWSLWRTGSEQPTTQRSSVLFQVSARPVVSHESHLTIVGFLTNNSSDPPVLCFIPFCSKSGERRGIRLWYLAVDASLV